MLVVLPVCNDQADVHRLFRNFHADEFLVRERHAEVHVHRGEIVHTVRVGEPLRTGQILTNFFGTAMEVAEMWRYFVDDLAICA